MPDDYDTIYIRYKSEDGIIHGVRINDIPDEELHDEGMTLWDHIEEHGKDGTYVNLLSTFEVIFNDHIDAILQLPEYPPPHA